MNMKIQSRSPKLKKLENLEIASRLSFINLFIYLCKNFDKLHLSLLIIFFQLNLSIIPKERLQHFQIPKVVQVSRNYFIT